MNIEQLVAERGKMQAALTNLETKLLPLLSKQAEEIQKHAETRSETAKKIDEIEKSYDSRLAEIKDAHKEIKTMVVDLEKKLERPSFGDEVSRKSLGETLVTSAQFKSWVDGGASKSSVPVTVEGGVWGPSFPEFKSFTGTSATDAREVLSVQKLQGIYADPLRPDRVRDLIPVITTNLGLIEWVDESAFSNQANVVAEGEVKPESDMTLEQNQVAMRTIAHGITVARQFLDDVSALRQYIDMRLYDGLKVVEDVQILYGTGSGANIQGILTASGIQTFDWETEGSAKDTKIDAIRRGITKAQKAFYPVSGMVMHPEDWQDIELIKSTEGLYVWVNVGTGANPMLWRVPVVVTTAIQAETVLLGSFRQGTILWDREQTNIRVSEHHKDQFARNQVFILCEERVCQSVVLPKSFVKLDISTKPAS